MTKAKKGKKRNEVKVDFEDLGELLLVSADTSEHEICKKLFQLRDFEFITVTPKGKNLKQQECLEALTSGQYREILYGGAAGGAKSWTGASWLVYMCETYAGSKWFVGRESLTKLEQSTIETFKKVIKHYQVEGVVWKQKGNYLLFGNGSRIDFIDLGFYPGDKEFERFGSVEYTGGWIEEASEIHFGAFDVMKTRIGRWMNDELGIKPVLFVTCNPKKNWLYYEFYGPWKRKALRPNQYFIQAFVQDNPAVGSDYIDQLRSISEKSKKERLLLGNWDYEDDPNTLCDFDAIMDMFTNDHVDRLPGDRFGSADLAMKGRDRFVGGSWRGFSVVVKIDKEFATGKEIEKDVKQMMIEDAIPHSKMIVDSDGLGSYLESYLVGIKEFHGAAAATDKEFLNMKSQCGFKLAEIVNKRLIKIHCTEEQKQRIIHELGVLKSKDVDADEKRKRLISKEEMKDLLRRSPDYLDMLLMRMYFEVIPDIYGIAA